MSSRNPIRHHAKIPAIPLPVVAGQLKSERRIALFRARLRRLLSIQVSGLKSQPSLP